MTPVYQWFTSVIASFFTIIPWAIILLGLMILDVATGLLYSGIKGAMSSSACREGLMKKVMTAALIAAALMVELLFGLMSSQLPDNMRAIGDGAANIPWGRVFAFLFSLVEMLSIIENAGRAGVPIPKRFMDWLSVITHNEFIGKGSSEVRMRVPGGTEAKVEIKSDSIRRDATQQATSTPLDDPTAEMKVQTIEIRRQERRDRAAEGEPNAAS